MKLSLIKLLNEIKVEDVAQRAMSKRFLRANAKQFELSNQEEILKTANFVMRNIAMEVTQKDIPEQFKGLALQWFVAQFISGAVVAEQSSAVFDAIEKFLQVQKFAREKALVNIKSFPELVEISDEAFKKYQNYLETNKVAKLRRTAKYDKVLETNKYDIYIPHNEAAACVLGMGTRWCTAATESQNYFDDYHKPDDPLFVLFDKQTKEKFQIHFGSDQFMNAQDEQISEKERLELLTALQPLKNQFDVIWDLRTDPENEEKAFHLKTPRKEVYFNSEMEKTLEKTDDHVAFFSGDGMDNLHNDYGPAFITKEKRVWYHYGIALAELETAVGGDPKYFIDVFGGRMTIDSTDIFFKTWQEIQSRRLASLIYIENDYGPDDVKIKWENDVEDKQKMKFRPLIEKFIQISNEAAASAKRNSDYDTTAEEFTEMKIDYMTNKIRNIVKLGSFRLNESKKKFNLRLQDFIRL